MRARSNFPLVKRECSTEEWLWRRAQKVDEYKCRKRERKCQRNVSKQARRNRCTDAHKRHTHIGMETAKTEKKMHDGSKIIIFIVFLVNWTCRHITHTMVNFRKFVLFIFYWGEADTGVYAYVAMAEVLESIWNCYAAWCCCPYMKGTNFYRYTGFHWIFFLLWSLELISPYCSYIELKSEFYSISTGFLLLVFCCFGLELAISLFVRFSRLSF